jgi:hypothetical protein
VVPVAGSQFQVQFPIGSGSGVNVPVVGEPLRSAWASRCEHRQLESRIRNGNQSGTGNGNREPATGTANTSELEQFNC